MYYKSQITELAYLGELYLYAASLEIILHSATQVIDAEMARRKLLEESPIPSTQEEPVLFDTSEIPWWAWVRRFHLPEVCSLYWSVAHLCIESWQHLGHGLDLHTELVHLSISLQFHSRQVWNIVLLFFVMTGCLCPSHHPQPLLQAARSSQ